MAIGDTYLGNWKIALEDNSYSTQTIPRIDAPVIRSSDDSYWWMFRTSSDDTYLDYIDPLTTTVWTLAVSQWINRATGDNVFVDSRRHFRSYDLIAYADHRDDESVAGEEDGYHYLNFLDNTTPTSTPAASQTNAYSSQASTIAEPSVGPLSINGDLGYVPVYYENNGAWYLETSKISSISGKTFGGNTGGVISTVTNAPGQQGHWMAWSFPFDPAVDGDVVDTSVGTHFTDSQITPIIPLWRENLTNDIYASNLQWTAGTTDFTHVGTAGYQLVDISTLTGAPTVVYHAARWSPYDSKHYLVCWDITNSNLHIFASDDATPTAAVDWTQLTSETSVTLPTASSFDKPLKVYTTSGADIYVVVGGGTGGIHVMKYSIASDSWSVHETYSSTDLAALWLTYGVDRQIAINDAASGYYLVYNDVDWVDWWAGSAAFTGWGIPMGIA